MQKLFSEQIENIKYDIQNLLDLVGMKDRIVSEEDSNTNNGAIKQICTNIPIKIRQIQKECTLAGAERMVGDRYNIKDKEYPNLPNIEKNKLTRVDLQHYRNGYFQRISEEQQLLTNLKELLKQVYGE